MARSKARQTQFAFRTHGGKRRGAGRPPRGGAAAVPHVAREPFTDREPVLATLKLCPELCSLRGQRVTRAIVAAFFAARESLARVVHFSVQRDHVHLIAEARDEKALSRGIQGLAVRLARALNRLLGRTGKVWKDRFHARVLRTPRQVRNAIRYVLLNARKHGVPLPSRVLDPCSSAAAFDGWLARVVVSSHEIARAVAAVVVEPRSWLLRAGWRRAGGLLDPDHRPGPLADG